MSRSYSAKQHQIQNSKQLHELLQMDGLNYEDRHIHLYMTTGIIRMSSVLIMVS